VSAGVHFDLGEAERHFGPVIVAESKRDAAAAPRFRPEQIAFLRALFGSVRIAGQQAPAADAA
jgi:hypothetical protein